jgi:predicted XRE-type DNA-binding protein
MDGHVALCSGEIMHSVLKVFLVAAVAAASVTAGAQMHRDDPRFGADVTDIETRLQRQQLRIDRGIERGLLTRDEARRLRIEHRRIERMQARAMADGRVTRWEADRLIVMLDHADQHIRALRRNLDEEG